MELLRQPQYNPWPLHHQIALIYAGSRGYLDKVEVSQINRWSHEFVRYLDTSRQDVAAMIMDGSVWNDEIEDAIKQVIIDFNSSWSS